MLFIHPVWERFGGELSDYIPVGVPVAIGYLAQYLIQHGHKVKVHDEELETYNIPPTEIVQKQKPPKPAIPVPEDDEFFEEEIEFQDTPKTRKKPVPSI